MEDLSLRLIRDAIREAEDAIQPLVRASRSQAHLYRFFLEIGWDLKAALGVDLAAVRNHLEAARGAIAAIQGAIAQGDEAAAALAARDAFKAVMQRAEPLYETLTAAAPVPVQDHVLQAFVEDLALHLATLHLAGRSPFAFRLGQMAGLIRAERATPLYASPPGRQMLRYPVERMLIRPRHLVMGALNPALALLAELDEPEGLLERLGERLDAEARRVVEATRGRGLQGLELRLEPTGLHVTGGPLPRPPAGGAPVRLPLHASGTPALEIAPEGYGLTWAPDLAPDGAITLFETSGVRFFLPGRPSATAAATGLTLAQVSGELKLDLVGALGVELPADVVTGEAGDAVRASARVHVEHRQGRLPSLSLDEMRLQGRFHVGGPDGLLIEEAELVVGQLAWPLAPPTVARPLPFDLKVRGVLSFPDDDFRLEVEAEYLQGTWTLRSTGHARFPNGVELRPRGARPVFELQASPATGLYRLAASGEVRFPQGDDTAGIGAQGQLTIRMRDGLPRIEAFAVRGEATDWSLGDGLEVDRLAVGLGYQPGRFTATVAAAIPFGDGFVLEILEEVPASVATGAPAPGLTVVEDGSVLTATVAGGVRITFPADVLTSLDDSLPVKVEAAGVLTLSTAADTPPSLSNLSFALQAPRLRLGGEDGLILEDVALLATNIDRLFVRDQAPFAVITLSGTVICPIEMSSGRLTLELKGAQFTFKRPDRLPDFAFAENGKLGVENATPAGFPLEVTDASLTLKAPGPLPEALRPTNLEVGLSVALAADFSDMAAAVAGVEGIRADIHEGLPRVSFDGVKFGVDDLQIPPMRFSGALGIHNLQNPLDLQLEGVLGGTMQGATVKALVALKLDQGKPMPLGVCLDVNLGPSGVSVCYGFTIQGASGGISFANTNADPCAFSTYSEAGARVRAAGAGQAITTGGKMPATRPAPFSGCHCECPPPAMNILCQPHPDQDLHPGRAILKFSALEERMWADLPAPRPGGGVTTLGGLLDEADQAIRQEIAGHMAGFDAAARAEDLARQVTAALKSTVAGMIPSLNPATIQPRPPPEAQAAFNRLARIYLLPAEHWAEEMGARLAYAMGAQFQGLAAGASPPTLRRLVADQLYRGVNCPDMTMQVTGSFSYVGVSSFAYVTGGESVSSAGSVGVLGILTVFGVPFGVLRAFVTATDAAGALEPSICGDLLFEMGPIRFGEMCVEYRIPGAVINFADALGRFGRRVSKPVIRRVLARMEREDMRFSDRAGFDLDGNLAGSLAILTQPESAQFISCLLSEPDLTPAQAQSVALFAAELARDLWAGFNPQVTICGEVAPEIFGIQLARLAQAKAVITKDRLAAEFSFSPLYVLGRFFPLADLFSGMDSAAMGVGLTFPTLESLITEGLVAHFSGQRSFDQVVEDGIARTLRETTLTFSYQFFPLGMRLADTQGRIIMPYLTPHPAARASTWRNPDDAPGVGPSARPKRREVLFAALDGQRLRDIAWDGKLSDIMTLPPGQDLELQRDYFPHGGVLAASKILVPRLLWDPPPLDLLQGALRTDDWGVRLRSLVSFIKDWVLATREAGTLAFYLPAPTPPGALINRPSFAMRDMAEAMRRLDPSVLDPDGTFRQGPGMALDLAFFEGVARGQLLGLQLGEADITFTPPPAAGGSSAMHVGLKLAQDPRLAKWIDPVAADLAITQGADTLALSTADRQSLDERFGALQRRLEERRRAAGGGSAADLASVRAVVESASRALAGHLPKASLVAQVGARAPDELAPWLGMASASATIRAYSPLFDVSATGDTALDRVRRHGGWWFRSELRFRFGDLLRVTTWIEASLELGEDLTQPARLVGEAALNTVNAFTFLGAPVQMTAAIRLAMDTGAKVGDSVLALKGESGPLVFGPVRIEPVAGPRLTVELHARRAAAGPDVALRLAPARLRLPGLDPSTPVDVLADAGQTLIELGAAGGAVRAEAPNGLKLVSPTGATILQLAGPLSGRLTFGGALPSLSVKLPRGLQLMVFPQDPVLQRSVTLGAATTLTVKGDGTFALETALPPISLAGGLFVVHGSAGPPAPIPVTLTEREARLNGAARLSIQVPGAARTTAVVETLVMGPNGAFEVRGSGASVRLPGLLESSAAGFLLMRGPQGFELGIAGAELRFAALPGSVQRWNLTLRANAFEADLAVGAALACPFGSRLSISGGAWKLRGSFTELSLTASAPQVLVLGRAVGPAGSATLALTATSAGPRVTARLSTTGDLSLIPNVLQLSPSSVRLDWSPTGGSVALSTRVCALRRPDGTQGWVLDRTLDLLLAGDRFNQSLAGQVQLFGKTGLTVSGELAVGFDGAFFVAANNLAVTCLNSTLATVSGTIRGDGRLTVGWASAPSTPLGPFLLKLGKPQLTIDTLGASVQMALTDAEVSAGGQGWPAGTRKLNGLRLGWTSGNPAPLNLSVSFGGNDSGTRSLGLADYKLTTPAVSAAINLSGGQLTVGALTLSGSLSAWTRAKRPDNDQPWASASLTISRTVSTNGSVTLSLPPLDPGSDPLRSLRDACYAIKERDFPIPSLPQAPSFPRPPRGAPGEDLWKRYDDLKNSYNNAVNKLNEEKGKCDRDFPGPPAAIPQATTGPINLKDLFSFRSP